MAIKYSELELAINTMVTEFHRAAGDGPTMSPTQLHAFISTHMPLLAKAAQGEEGLDRVLKQMGVQKDQNISFDHFWTLIRHQAAQQFSRAQKEKGDKLNCSLQ
ncbi:protein S100-A10-like isoform X2 [Poeciliopsis prolifica]|uniref:protein S100-A10-like isoform X2 n=1 Tax=Poeciliopsis prolifica TaxID=188132 RepID=UPI002413E002|nr:protein S100-A10-like isoform X2 [Poeciliopsis prolifica]